MKTRYIAAIILTALTLTTMLFGTNTAIAGESTGFSFSHDQPVAEKGKELTVTIAGEEVTKLYAYEVIVRYDPQKLALKNIMPKISGKTVSAEKITDGTIFHGCTKIGNEPVQGGTLDLCSIAFEALAAGETDITLETVNIVQKNEDGSLNKITYSVNRHLTISIRGEGSQEPSPTPTEAPSPYPTYSPAPEPEPVVSPNPSVTPAPAVVTIYEKSKVTYIKTEVEASVENETGTASVNLSGENVAELIAKAYEFEKSGESFVMEISVNAEAGAKAFSIGIETDTFKMISGLEHAELQVNAGGIEIAFDGKALDAISEAAGGNNVSIDFEQVDNTALSKEARDKIGDRPVYRFSVSSGDVNITDFKGGYVHVSIPYEPAEDEDIESIVVYYIDNTGNLHIATGRYVEETGRVHFSTPHFSMFAVGYNRISFTDVPPDAYYHKAVSFLSARYITKGVGRGRFAPSDLITRADLLVLIMNAYGIEPEEGITDNFSDAGNKYYTPYLATARKLGLVKGVGNNLYLPEVPITRQDMFVIIYNILGMLDRLPDKTGVRTLADFSDADEISGYAAEALKTFVESGRIQGYGGRLHPKSTATRAEAAQILYNLLNALY